MSDTEKTRGNRPMWYRPLTVFMAFFGAVGWPLSVLVIADGAFLTGIAVIVTGTLLASLAVVAWIIEPVYDIRAHASDLQ